ncbi:MAG TPA: kelch repeat-containing protein [Candidatus Limnocylindrales bacterium]
MASFRLAALLLALAVAGCFQSSATPSRSGAGPSRASASPSPAPTPTTPPGFSLTGWMTTSRSGHTATLLGDGTVLIAGGSAIAGISDAERYDPTTGTFSPTGPATTKIPSFHTATLLSDGRVLIAGGLGPTSSGSIGPMATAQLYDPKTGKFGPTGSMSTGRDEHTATLLSDGRVLIAGGAGGNGGASAELYDPKTGKFGPTGSMTTVRASHTGTLLSDGRVLIVGGYDGSTWLASAELYDPKTGTFSATGSMTVARFEDTATLLSDGRVLVAGGWTGGNVASGQLTPLSSAELYDPKTGAFSATGSMTIARSVHTAARLADGRILVAGGVDANGAASASAELYDSKTGKFSAAESMSDARIFATATALSDGVVLIAGGGAGGQTGLASAELYQPSPAAAPSPTPLSHFSPTGSLAMGRFDGTAILLSDGRVFIAGGQDVEGGGSDTPELYDPKTGSFSPTDAMLWPTISPTVAQLPDGRVLVAGGIGSAGTVLKRDYIAELFDPKTGKFSQTGSLKVPRYDEAGVALADGRVLLAGGAITELAVDNGNYYPGDSKAVASAELYNPKTGTLSLTGSMTIARDGPTATRLEDGQVLIAGGSDVSVAGGAKPVASAELYNPKTGSFTATGSMGTARYGATATLLADGRVLMVGGEDGNGIRASAEVYDPKSGTFGPVGSMATVRAWHTATLLRDGRVLVVGGSDGPDAPPSAKNVLASAELFDPTSGTFSPAGSMATSRQFQSAVLLGDGRVLIVGGTNGYTVGPAVTAVALDSAELYAP